jgi:tetratricopeptide (TPR) repeat protein
VEFKRNYPVEGSLYAEAALAINDLSTRELVSDANQLHDLVAKSATDPAVAIKHLRAAVDLAPRDLSLVPLQRFGLRERLGYWLHEGQFFAEAQQVNMQLLADAERELGKDHEALLTVLENLAQNHYALEQPDAASVDLQRCLALARQHARPEVESRMLFQLGVLAHEQGNDDEARRYMNERVEHAKRNPDLGLLDGAQSSLAELELRIAEERKIPGSGK